MSCLELFTRFVGMVVNYGPLASQEAWALVLVIYLLTWYR